MESVKCKHFCFFIGLAAKDHIRHTCVNPFKSLTYGVFQSLEQNGLMKTLLVL